MKNLNVENRVFISTIMAILYILLVLITCTCSGQKLMLEHLNIESQTDSSLYSGKLAKQITGVTVCATSKTDDLDSLLWQAQNLSTKLQYLPMLDLGYFPSLEQMPKRCLRIKLSQYPLIIRFSSNQFKTVWTGQRLSWHIGFRHPNLLEESWKRMNSLQN